MKNLSLLILFVALIASSCSSVTNKIFNNNTPRENYEESIEDTPGGEQWLLASRSALEQPQSISLPFNMQGYFAPDKARSLGIKFKAKRGEQVSFSFNRISPSAVIYADLFSQEDIQSALVTVDTAASVFSIDIENTGEYILRLQPELFNRGEYELKITKGPSLGFPVAGRKANIGSFWGADRDGGKRSHEGIDIFAAKRTPVVASADGMITRVNEGDIGGKVVWQRVAGKNLSLYYAHLDKQLVSAGQFVKKGDTIGLVGNTGNARTTPPHLHFGIYTYGGAIDPLAFVKISSQKIPSIPDRNIAGKQLKITKTQMAGSLKIEPDTIAEPIGITSSGYLAEIAGGIQMLIPFSAVRAENKKMM